MFYYFAFLLKIFELYMCVFSILSLYMSCNKVYPPKINIFFKWVFPHYQKMHRLILHLNKYFALCSHTEKYAFH